MRFTRSCRLPFAGLFAAFCAHLAVGATVRWELGLTIPPAAAEHTAQRLVRWAEAAKTPAQAAERHLAAANWMLGPQLAPLATRFVLGEIAPEDAEAARRLVAAARVEIAAAAAAVESWPAASPDQDDPTLDRVKHDLVTLRAFGNAFDALWPEPATSTAELERLRTDAALELSESLEDTRGEVAQAAVLWQACLFESVGRTQRAVDGLPSILAVPSGDSPFGLYARLLHCRLAAKSKESSPGLIAAVARLERRCVDWVAPDAQQQARRTVAYVRRGLLTAWAQELRTAGEPERAAWCDAEVASVDAAYFAPQEPAALLALSGGAPAVVSLDRLDERIEGRTDRPPAPGPSPTASPAPEADTAGLEGPPSAPPDAEGDR